MGLSFGLERGEVTPEDLSKARTMVPRALEQYVVELAQRGPGDCSSIPKVTPAKILKEEAIELPLALPLPPGMAMAESSANSENDDSDVDINWNLQLKFFLEVLIQIFCLLRHQASYCTCNMFSFYAQCSKPPFCPKIQLLE